MSSADFRQIATNDAGRAERLFRAAVSAFCSLTRPSRREVVQLEDLALPLFDAVSVEARRYVAAALSECHPAPPALVRRLADEAIDIAAPLLMRSRALSDVDLVALVGRHGLPHARAIARRDGLNPVIGKLVEALEAMAVSGNDELTSPEQLSEDEPAMHDREQMAVVGRAAPGTNAENTRQQLRSMMLAAHRDGNTKTAPLLSQTAEAKLRETALTGNLAFFQTALADALDIDFRIAKSIAEASGYAALMAALRVLDISEDRAFVIAASIRPGLFTHAETIRLFLERYRLMHREAAADALRGWKAESIALSMRRPKPARLDRPHTAAIEAQDNAVRLKAS